MDYCTGIDTLASVTITYIITYIITYTITYTITYITLYDSIVHIFKLLLITIC